MKRLGCFLVFRRYGWLALLVNAAFLWAPAAAGEAVRVTALGDSLTAGYGLPADETFTVQLEVALRAAGAKVTIANAGVSGDTTAGGLARLDWVMADRPALVIVELGANDGLRGLDPDMTYQNLDQILARLAAAGARVLLAGMYAPPNLGREYGEAFDTIYPRLAEKHGVALYPFFLEGVATDPALNQHDGIHPNAAGVAAIVERIVPYVLAVLAAD